MAITTRDDLIGALAGGYFVPIYKGSMANQAAGYITSLWRATGAPAWQQGAIPSTAAYCDDTLAGGIPLPSFGSDYGYILNFSPVGATIGTFFLYDRLAHMGGLSGTNTGVQTVSVDVATPLSNGRCQSDYKDIEWYVEIYTDIGTTATNLTVTYTDSADTGSKTITITGFTGASPLNRVGRCVPILPTDGIPIKSIQSVQLNVSSGTAGSFGITARKKLCSVGQYLANIQANGSDAISIGIPRIMATTCLEILVQCSTTSTGIVYGMLQYGLT